MASFVVYGGKLPENEINTEKQLVNQGGVWRLGMGREGGERI